ncbi:MAG: DUF1345 domain-containing protein [Ilumatobacteraceae bacterium]
MDAVAAMQMPPTARRRLVVAFSLAMVVGVAVGLVGAWQLAVLAAFDVWALVQLVWLAVRLLPLDAAQTSLTAKVEDNSRAMSSLLVNIAGLTSLIGVGLALVKAKQVGTVQEVVITIAAVLTVILAWLTVHTVFTLRYADLFYNDDAGGVDFPGDQPPSYHDFAYLGFTVGMTYQVSDTNITSRDIRRAITRHALISYLFGTVIIGLAINVTAGFIR